MRNLHMGVAAVAVLVAVAGGVSGCGAESGQATEAAGEALPPGVLAPNDPPQPGDARLGPDGHYDYSAPDFVLKNPCDTEYFQRALELGWEVPPFGTKRRDEPEEMYCGIITENSGLAMFSFPMNFKDYEASIYEVEITTQGDLSLILVKRPTLFGEGCFIGIETPTGTLGGLSATGGFSTHATIDEACNDAMQSIIPILGVNK